MGPAKRPRSAAGRRPASFLGRLAASKWPFCVCVCVSFLFTFRLCILCACLCARRRSALDDGRQFGSFRLASAVAWIFFVFLFHRIEVDFDGVPFFFFGFLPAVGFFL